MAVRTFIRVPPAYRCRGRVVQLPELMTGMSVIHEYDGRQGDFEHPPFLRPLPGKYLQLVLSRSRRALNYERGLLLAFLFQDEREQRVLQMNDS